MCRNISAINRSCKWPLLHLLLWNGVNKACHFLNIEYFQRHMFRGYALYHPSSEHFTVYPISIKKSKCLLKWAISIIDVANNLPKTRIIACHHWWWYVDRDSHAEQMCEVMADARGALKTSIWSIDIWYESYIMNNNVYLLHLYWLESWSPEWC